MPEANHVWLQDQGWTQAWPKITAAKGGKDTGQERVEKAKAKKEKRRCEGEANPASSRQNEPRERERAREREGEKRKMQKERDRTVQDSTGQEHGYDICNVFFPVCLHRSKGEEKHNHISVLVYV